jgi:hypothetical protein
MQSRSRWILIVLALESTASAQSGEATALFKEGRKLMEDGEIAAACEKFEAADALERQVGFELNVGDCRDKNGQTATAWAAFVKAAATAKQSRDPREKEARDRARSLEKRLVKLTIRVPTDSDIDGLVIKRNDKEIPRGGWNDAVPVDPDEYTISAEAPGRKTWSETIIVKSKDKVIEVPELERAKRRVNDAHMPLRKHPDLPNANRGLTIVLAASGAGVAAIATGFAVYSQSVENRADALCPTTMCTNSYAVDLNHTARLDGWAANVGWILGGAALAGAGIAWWLGDKESAQVSVVPVINSDRAGLAVGGRF